MWRLKPFYKIGQIDL